MTGQRRLGVKKNLISLSTENGRVRLRMNSNSFVWMSFLSPRQARLLARELLKVADFAEIESPNGNVFKPKFKKHG